MNNSSRLGSSTACFPPPNQSSATASKSLSLSTQGLQFIKGWEKFSGKLYDTDGANACTIGYGHLVHKGKCSGAKGEMPYTKGVDEKQATDLLNGDVSGTVTSVRQSVNVELTQYEFDALVSFAFNVGAGNFRGSTLLTYVNSGDWKKIQPEFMRWTHSGGKVVAGLTKRRRAEANMFLYGIYDSSH